MDRMFAAWIANYSFGCSMDVCVCVCGNYLSSAIAECWRSVSRHCAVRCVPIYVSVRLHQFVLNTVTFATLLPETLSTYHVTDSNFLSVLFNFENKQIEKAVERMTGIPLVLYIQYEISIRTYHHNVILSAL